MNLTHASCGCTFDDTSFLAGTCGAGFALFMGLVEYVLKGQCDISDPCRRLGVRDSPDVLENEYDFIIVGAGVAGSVMASRLSEIPFWKILLLEAGPNEPTVTAVPAFSSSAVGTILDWNYTTESSTLACLSTGGRCKWPRGKMVAGSSGMQGMMYTRPNPAILDGWCKNNPGWCFNETLPYFKKSENNLNPEIVDPGYHGFSGPLTVQQFKTRPKLADVLVEAAEQLGYRNGDLNGRNQTGAAVAQMMVFKGLRASTPRMYLRPHLSKRGNLMISLKSHVIKILIDHSTKKATGVKYMDNSRTLHTAHVRKEVIISAGTVNSPQLLLLSGVGPREDLAAVGIDTIVDLPGVGRNLHNHVAGAIHFYMNDSNTDSLTLESLKEFVEHRTGNMSSTGLTQTTLFMTSKYAKDGVADLQVYFDGYLATCSKTGTPQECVSTGNIGNCGRRVIGARPTNVRPRSRGYLKLNSSNPFDHPLIQPNYLQDQHDLDVLVDGIKLMIQLAMTPALQKYGFTVVKQPVSGCENYTFGSDEYFACAIRVQTGPENHEAGSCKMGPLDDSMAVVNNELEVHGMKYLRVVDASIFPQVPNSNPTSVIVMAAEKVSDKIKTVWKYGGISRTIKILDSQ